MSELYFCPRKQFSFSANTFDIGTWHKHWRRDQLNRFVLRKIFQIGAGRFPDFYYYHLEYYRATQKNAEESKFHKYLFDEANDDLERLKKLSIYSKKNAENLVMKDTLVSVIEFLKSIDLWNSTETADATIAKQQIKITELESQNKTLVNLLKEFKQLDTSDYINIREGYRDTLLDLMLQMQGLTLPDGRELVFSQTQAAWTKMICKFFREDNQEIKHDTIRRYFPSDKRDPGIKHAPIKEKFKLFHIKISGRKP
ncbi:hypothetical protein [Pedobacter sp. V48]|uniref:hypothetical protein n=1 Tax=Pedobacter sp. V48 TaxID=509635 RepID=UPI0003E4E6B7|nr:hypothetical protein [Pedobacter sp. V48]ETZ19541.1 hypothetical protein N824_12430 [Pedobacter sp. V48]